jgi:arylsulfatase A-like enzyme
MLYRILNSVTEIRDIGAETVTQAAVTWIGENAHSSFFVWLHYMDVHGPQLPPAQYVRKYDPNWGTGPRTASKLMNVVEGRRKALLQGGNAKQALSPRDLSQQIAIYDGGLDYVDDQIGIILQQLRDLGIAERTVIIITADHGEALGDRNQFGHAHIPYEPVERIPLVISAPHLAPRGRVVDGLVSTLDFFPSIVDLVGGSVPPGLQGRSFLPLVRGEPWPDRSLYMECISPDAYFLRHSPDRLPGVSGKVRMLRTDRWKLIYIPRQGEHRYEFYDLENDPGETKNLYTVAAETAGAYREKLLSHLLATENPAATQAEEPLDRRTREDLRALGYVE